MTLYIPGDAQPSDVLQGKKFSAGTLFNVDGTYVVPVTAGSSLITQAAANMQANFKMNVPPGTYADASSILTATDANFVADNIKSGVTIFGRTGTLHDTPTLTRQTVTVPVSVNGGTLIGWNIALTLPAGVTVYAIFVEVVPSASIYVTANSQMPGARFFGTASWNSVNGSISGAMQSSVQNVTTKIDNVSYNSSNGSLTLRYCHSSSFGGLSLTMDGGNTSLTFNVSVQYM